MQGKDTRPPTAAVSADPAYEEDRSAQESGILERAAFLLSLDDAGRGTKRGAIVSRPITLTKLLELSRKAL